MVYDINNKVFLFFIPGSESNRVTVASQRNIFTTKSTFSLQALTVFRRAAYIILLQAIAADVKIRAGVIIVTVMGRCNYLELL